PPARTRAHRAPRGRLGGRGLRGYDVGMEPGHLLRARDGIGAGAPAVRDRSLVRSRLGHPAPPPSRVVPRRRWILAAAALSLLAGAPRATAAGAPDIVRPAGLLEWNER